MSLCASRWCRHPTARRALDLDHIRAYVEGDADWASNSGGIPRECARGLRRRLLRYDNAGRGNEMLPVYAVFFIRP